MICPFIESAFYYEEDKKDTGNAVFLLQFLILTWCNCAGEKQPSPQSRQWAVTLDSVAQTEVKIELSSDYIMNGVDHIYGISENKPDGGIVAGEN